jgi:hypothetical protein
MNNYETMTYKINIKVSEGAAMNIHKEQKPHLTLNEISQMEKELDILLKPLYPDTNDRVLSSYFTVDVPDKLKAEQVVHRLTASPYIEGVNVVPKEAEST